MFWFARTDVFLWLKFEISTCSYDFKSQNFLGSVDVNSPLDAISVSGYEVNVKLCKSNQIELQIMKTFMT